MHFSTLLLYFEIVPNIFLKLQNGIIKSRNYFRGWSGIKNLRLGEKFLPRAFYFDKGRKWYVFYQQKILKAVHTIKAWICKQNQKSLWWNEASHQIKCLWAAGVRVPSGYMHLDLHLQSAFQRSIQLVFLPSTLTCRLLVHNYSPWPPFGEMSNSCINSWTFHCLRKIQFHQKPLVLSVVPTSLQKLFFNRNCQFQKLKSK